VASGGKLQAPRGTFDVLPDEGRRRAALPRPIVTGERPEITRLGAPPPGVENRRRGFVDEQLGRAQQLLAHQPPHGFDLGGGIAGPEGQH